MSWISINVCTIFCRDFQNPLRARFAPKCTPRTEYYTNVSLCCTTILRWAELNTGLYRPLVRSNTWGQVSKLGGHGVTILTSLLLIVTVFEKAISPISKAWVSSQNLSILHKIMSWVCVMLSGQSITQTLPTCQSCQLANLANLPT